MRWRGCLPWITILVLFVAARWLAGWPRGTRVHRQADLLEYVVAQQSLNYPVGDF